MLVSFWWHAISEAVDVGSQFRDNIWNANKQIHRALPMQIWKTRVQFSIFVLALHDVICFFLMICIDHGGLDICSRKIRPQGWRMRAQSKAHEQGWILVSYSAVGKYTSIFDYVFLWLVSTQVLLIPKRQKCRNSSICTFELAKAE